MKRKQSIPLAPPPKMPSRKRARKITTEFHRLTRQVEAATEQDEQALLRRKIAQLRPEYQKASQTSVSFFSTSKWVIGYLSRNGWLYGIRSQHDPPRPPSLRQTKEEKTAKTNRRNTHLLEIGAINTELLDASAAVKDDKSPKYRLSVRAIDIHSMDPRIEEADFLKISTPQTNHQYDVIVCSMVINCVATAKDRGLMLARIYRFLREGALCFLTLPRTCLELSPYCDKNHFEKALQCVGLQILETKNSPKIAFFICQRLTSPNLDYLSSFRQESILRRGKQFRNDFSLILTSSMLMDDSL